MSKSAPIDVQAVEEVVGVDDRLAAGLVGQEHQGVLQVARVDRLDVGGQADRAELGAAHPTDAQAGRVDGVDGDPVGAGGVGDVGEAPAGVVVEALHDRVAAIGGADAGLVAVAAAVAVALVERPEEVLTGAHLQSFADVEHRLATGHAGELIHRSAQAIHRELQVVEDVLGVHLGAPERHLAVATLVDLLEHVDAVGVLRAAAAGVLLELVGGVGDELRVGGETAHHLERAVVGHQHDAIVAVELGVEELPQEAEQLVAVDRRDVLLIDVHHQVEALVLGHVAGLEAGVRVEHLVARLRPLGLDRFDRLVLDLFAFLVLVEVGDGDRLAVLVELEVVER